MRATINFEVDVDQVENTMATLVAMESDTLRAIADMIDVNPGPRTMVLEEVTEALRLLEETSAQLEQYKGMLLSFERAKFQTMLPQEAHDQNQPPPALPSDDLGRLQNHTRDMVEFNRFMGGINAESRDTEFMNLDESPPITKEEE